MKIAVLLFVLLLSFASAAEPRQLLQEGLFEEEANRDLDKASAAYESLIASFDKERQYAATALFRLAEIRAKQNRKEDALALFQRVLTEFSTNDPLARLSRERIATLGGNAPAIPGGTPAISDKESQEVARLQDLIKNSPDLLNTGPDGVSTLVRAAREGWMKAAALLLDQSVKIDEPRGRTSAIHAAASNGRKAMIELLLARGADLNIVDEQQRTPLQIATELARFEVARVLVERGADPNAGLSGGEDIGSPLYYACVHENLPLVRLLLDKRANVNAISKGEGVGVPVMGSPLMAAIRNKNLELVTLLLDRGAKPDLKVTGKSSVSSPLTEAVMAKSVPIVEKLLERGVSVKDRDPWLVFVAASNNDPKMVRFLVAKGADIDAKFPEGTQATAMHAVAESLEMTKLFLELGASPKVTDAAKFTPLHTAISLYPGIEEPDSTSEKKRDPFPTIQLLVKHGAPINAQTNDGATPLHFALSRKTPNEVIDWLLANGADPNIKDKHALPPASYAPLPQRLEFERRTLYPTLAKQNAIHAAFLKDGPYHAPFRIDPLAEFDAAPELKAVWERALVSLPDSDRQRPFNVMILRLDRDGKLAEAGRVNYARNQAVLLHPALQWGDIVVFGEDSLIPRDWDALRPITNVESEERVKAATRTVTIRIGDRETSIGLVRFYREPRDFEFTWTPSMGRIKELNVGDLVAKVAAGEPHAQLGAVKIQRAVNGEMKEWLIDLRYEPRNMQAIWARLADGDRVIVPLVKIDDPDALKARRSGVFRAAPGGVFGERVFNLHEKDDAPRTLGELIVESYCNSPLIVPHPDFSNIRIRRLKADASGEETLVVNLNKAIDSVSAKTASKEAAALDTPLQWGDIVEIPTIKDAKPSEWRGLDPQAKLFLTKALTREIQHRTNNGPFKSIQIVPLYAGFEPNSRPYEFDWKMSPREFSVFRVLRYPAMLGKNQVKIRLISHEKTREYTLNEFKAINPWLVAGDRIEVESY
jgi:ankyrin repeat protein